MKAGLSLQELALELHRQNNTKADFLVDTRSIRLDAYNSEVYLQMHDNESRPLEPLDVNSIAHQQIATYAGIPAPYYRRMLEEHPQLLAHNVNEWLQRKPAQRMLRTMDGTARAFLSNRYRRIDNMEIAEIVLPELQKLEGAVFESCQITETRMYIKVVNPRLQAEVSPGDIVQAGVIISNSEVGQGSVSIQPLVFRLVCSNGMVINDAQTKRYHLGQASSTDGNLEIYSNDTLAAIDTAFIKQMRDTVAAAVDQARFARVIDQMRTAQEASMNTQDIPNLIQLTGKEFGITESERSGVLQHLIEGKDLSLYGLSNAVTRYSQDVDSYDRATELEGIGYKILTMSARTWKTINQAA